jgi:hypothetical protein
MFHQLLYPAGEGSPDNLWSHFQFIRIKQICVNDTQHSSSPSKYGRGAGRSVGYLHGPGKRECFEPLKVTQQPPSTRRVNLGRSPSDAAPSHCGRRRTGHPSFGVGDAYAQVVNLGTVTECAVLRDNRTTVISTSEWMLGRRKTKIMGSARFSTVYCSA